MYSKSDRTEVIIKDEVEEFIEELFASLKKRY